jgi:hypothetical protein
LNERLGALLEAIQIAADRATEGAGRHRGMEEPER